MKVITRILSYFSGAGLCPNKTDKQSTTSTSLLFIKPIQLIAAFTIVLAIAACGDGGEKTVKTYTVGGSVNGLTGTLQLQNNAKDDLTLTQNGSFTFATSVNDKTTYNVTVLTQPVGQTCSITNGQGTISGTNITNVAVDCVINIDTTPPSIPGTPTDTGAFSLSTTVTFNWTAATDTESGIASYNLQAGSSVGGSDIFDGNVGDVVS